jgi:hypothetical protein
MPEIKENGIWERKPKNGLFAVVKVDGEKVVLSPLIGKDDVTVSKGALLEGYTLVVQHPPKRFH